ncbi:MULTISPECIES: hypothetical protein [unclassified Azospirillum]|uniref:hypothetical protein n=1 Tax=unclassified Azospirillum TaxID=2630922 RepID=UPI000B73BBA8|nr:MULTISPECIES: hypothetical protein [unclassified Azospirillum]SNS63034.1 hypothetical protein SAMN05880556_108129 [Azospirillum sp. RU38E]SNS82155.1 hypothetical protein SAMN05880591_108129 [Azospirillum sp. RU37A]
MRLVMGVFLAFCLGAVAMAAETPVSRRQGEVAAGIVFSSSGIGVEGQWQTLENLALRLDGVLFFVDKDFGIANVSYDGDATLASSGLTLDYFPWENRGWRASIGVRANFSELRAEGTARGAVHIAQVLLTPEQLGTVRGTAHFPRMAPYAGIGFTGPVGRDGLLAVMDLGLLYYGNPRVRITADGTLAGHPTFIAVTRNEEARLARELKSLAFYPAVKLGLLYRF